MIKTCSNSIAKKDLALAYWILGHLKWDDHTYTHLSLRSERGFLIYPFGLCFEEVEPDHLMEISLEGEVLSGCEYQYNQTGYVIHGQVYQQRPDIGSIFHLHTPEMVAVSTHPQGLMPLSQWALHFYERIAYHDYDSLALGASQGQAIVKDLQDHFVMLMRNHGALICGRTLQEALFYTHHLQKACQTQVMALAMKPDGHPFHQPSAEICRKAVHDLLNFEKELGQRDWQAWQRYFQKKRAKEIC